MKRWIFRLFALSAVTGLGWGAVILAQREWGAAGDGLPDLSQPPVNAEAAAAVSAEAGTVVPLASTAAGDRYSQSAAAVDPFRTVRTVAAEVAQPAEPAEPQQFTPEADAAPISAEPRKNELRDTIPAANDVGLTAAETAVDQDPGQPTAATDVQPARQADEVPRGADPFGLRAPDATTRVDGPPQTSATSTQPPGGAPADRYGNLNPSRAAPPGAPEVDPRGDSRAQQNIGTAAAAGVAAATGALEAAREDAHVGQGAATPAVGDRYGSEPAARGNRGAFPRGVPNDDMESRLDGSSVAGRASPQNLPLGAGRSEGAASATAGNLFRTSPATTPANPIAGVTASGVATGPQTSAADAIAPLDALPAAAAEGMAKPGDKKLEGAQSPTVTIEKLAPPEIQVGKPAKFEILVRNTGAVVAENVEVIDAVPQGTQLVSTAPKAATGPRGEVVWKLGDMQPGTETRLEMELMPVAEGEIGSVAMVQFRSAASARTIATKPELVLELTAPKQAMIGSDVAISIKLSNPGTGAASGVKLTEKVPQGFQHPAGSELEFEVGELRPGETRELALSLRAMQAGTFPNVLVAEGDANLRTEQTAAIEVIAPALEVAVEGPGLRYLERQAKYTVSVSNAGTAPAKDIELVTHLPKGLQFIEASDSGHYEAGTHSISWGLAELPAGQSGSVTLAAMAMESGEQKVRSEVRAAGGLSDTTEQVTMVEGAAAVLFTIVDVDDPVEVGGEATYEIRVVNQGSKAATRVQVVALLPPELKAASADGPTKNVIEGQKVVFEPLARLAPKADVTYKVVAQGVAPGDLRIKALLMTDDLAQPVTKEESTKVYKD